MEKLKTIDYKLKTVISLLLLITFSLASCREKKTEEPTETYRLWAGAYPPPHIKVLHGKYWESPHFTREYIMYIDLEAMPRWTKEFIQQNKLIRNYEHCVPPDDAPFWFRQKPGQLEYIPSEYSQGSIYFIDTTTGAMTFYEIQL